MHVCWIAAGLHEAQRSFRRVRGNRDLAALRRALDRQTLDIRTEGRVDAHHLSRRSGALKSDRDIP